MKAAALKTAGAKVPVGSNPTLSAIRACVVEWEYTSGLSPAAFWIEGSTPSASTIPGCRPTQGGRLSIRFYLL